MSAIRSGKSRRFTSRAAQSPYARPAAKKSSWSITGFLSYLNPLRSRSPAESSESLSSLDEDDESFESQLPFVAAPLSSRAEQISRDTRDTFVSTRQSISSPPPSQQRSKLGPPRTPARSDQLDELSSPAKNLEAVSNFLAERAGQTISDVEVEGLISLINKSTPPDQHEPFRFTSSTPSTPIRGNSPLAHINGTNITFTTPAAQTAISSPRKTLTKNPNGRYRWEGGGSSKLPRSRNRYSSPAFGPSRSSNDRILLKEMHSTVETPKDTKRRRVGDDAAQSSASPSGATTNSTTVDPPNLSYRSTAPDPSPTRTSEVQALPFPVSNVPPTPNRITNGISSSSRLRPPQLSTKPTVPVVPSPLRQAWSGGSSSSQSDSPPSQIPGAQKKSKAANFMAELIKEVTPPKRPDLSNPYQTASPVGKVGIPKPRIKRVRATGKPLLPDIGVATTKEKEKEEGPDQKDEKEYSPQAIIEATLPKGSKRSRPPAHLQKQLASTLETPLSSNPSTRQQDPKSESTKTSYIVEEVENDEDKRRSKKPKPHLNGRGLANTGISNKAGITIEEVDDIDMQTTVEKPSEIIPSSVTVVSSPTNLNPITGKSVVTSFKPTSAPKEPSKLRFSYQPEAGSSSALSAPPFVPIKSDITSLLPNPITVPITPNDGTDLKKPPAPTPLHEPIPSPSSGYIPLSSVSVSPKDVALSMPVDSLPTFVLNVRAFVYPTSEYHIKALKEAQALPEESLPSFDLSKLPALEAVPPVKAFDWAAAGVKPSPSMTGSGWTCSVCMLSNPATAITDCTICGSAR
ncbi:hypothetical protein BDZ94DRAFT_1260156 [Collybia nuda]|uniref:RanBP2-type domain-containing protein n=1 Tax=Collybia nuda TaxID=64659 RepID=A0A9P6CJK8_9AGAR|nr:hypothetical protein BDZ94DRAFT_1260156 [Collybia nuda]